MRINGYTDWIMDRADPAKALDWVAKGVEKLMEMECEEETVNDDPNKTRKNYPVVIYYIKDFF